MDVSPDTPTDPVSAEQARQNRSTERQWGFYDTHRRALERLIVPDLRGGRICVLGAGNCNDLDLKWLTEVYREVHLVDLDAAALDSAARRQGMMDSVSLHRHAPVDLTGIAPEVAAWSDTAPDEAAIGAATRKLLESPPPQWGTFDLVLSPCVLTQTINPVRDVLRRRYPPSHPARQAIGTALRLRHLRTIAASLSSGGRGVLAIDLISSEQFAELPRVPPEALEDLMRKFIAAGKHYSRLDPAGLAALWRGDARLSVELEPPVFSPPWLWHLGLRKSFLVYGATFHKK
jgi:hypothetical protein